jgi:hypothetical protein
VVEPVRPWPNPPFYRPVAWAVSGKEGGLGGGNAAHHKTAPVELQGTREWESDWLEM